MRYLTLPQDVAQNSIATAPVKTPPTVPKKDVWSFVKDIGTEIARPFVKTAVTGVATVDATGKLISGDVAGADKALEGYDVPGFGHVAPVKIGGDVTKGESVFNRNTLETIGTGAEIAATIAPGGGEAGLAEKTLGGAMKTGAKEAAMVGGVAGFGSSIQKKDASVASVAEGTLGGAATGAAFGAAIPLAQAGIQKGAQVIAGKSEIGGRLINSIIKPLKKDFAYGKNPGRTVASEGITGNSLEELASNISKRKDEIGKKITETAEKASAQTPGGVSINLEESVKPIDEAIADAVKGGPNNAGLVKRLQNVRDGLTNEFTLDAEGNFVKGAERNLSTLSPSEVLQFKRDVGNMTKWTGNASDDEAVNKALKQVYGKAKSGLNKAVPKVKTLSEKYADLISAETAAKYRDVIEQRQNLVSLAGQHAAELGGLAGYAIHGGATAVIGAIGGFGLKKAVESPAVMTRVAAWLARAEPEEREAVYKAYPALRNVAARYLTEGEQPKSRGRKLTMPESQK